MWGNLFLFYFDLYMWICEKDNFKIKRIMFSKVDIKKLNENCEEEIKKVF